MFYECNITWVIFFKKYISFIAIIVVLIFFVYLVPAVGEILWVSLKPKCIALNSFEKKKKVSSLLSKHKFHS